MRIPSYWIQKHADIIVIVARPTRLENLRRFVQGPHNSLEVTAKHWGAMFCHKFGVLGDWGSQAIIAVLR